jgi:hypothetical protein
MIEMTGELVMIIPLVKFQFVLARRAFLAIGLEALVFSYIRMHGYNMAFKVSLSFEGPAMLASRYCAT